MRSAPSIAFDYRPSTAIAALVCALVVAAIVAPWFSALAVGARIGLSFAVFAWGVFALRRFRRADFQRIAYRASGWALVDAAGAERQGMLASHARYGSLIALDFRLDARRRFRALVGPGNADAETRRRLILLLARVEVVQTG